MVTWYWVFEYAKVLCGYLFLMFLWPSVVFRKYLRGKSKIFWFSFCVTVQVVLVNTVVLSLGLVHILNRWVVIAVFYGTFLWSVLKDVRIGGEGLKKLQGLLIGTYGIKNFLLEDVVKRLKNSVKKFWKDIQPHFGEYLLLSIVLLYGMVYFSYGAFQDYSYGASDMYVHHSWIYGLIEGQIFSGKIYPEAMHCFVYTLYALFHIRVESILMLLAGIHIAVFLLSAYVLFREIFHWRYTAVFVIEFFLILDLDTGVMRDSMARLQWSLPQEFGLYTQFLCAAFLFRYLKSTHHIIHKGKISKNCWDENLLIFLLALAASITIHFYPTIMAFFLCISFALFFLPKIFTKGHFIPLVVVAMTGVLIAAAPMGGAFASGIEFQGSIGWALNVIKGDKSSQEKDQSETIQSEEMQKVNETQQISDEAEQKQVGSKRIENGLQYVIQRGIKICKEKVKIIYNYGYVGMHGAERAKWFARSGIFGIGLWMLYRILAAVFNLVFKGRIKRKECFDGYIPIILASFFYMMVYTGTQIGIPQLIDRPRICSSTQMLMLAVVAMPVDMVFSFLKLLCKDGLMQIASFLCSVAIFVMTNILGYYHGYLYFCMTRYNSVVMVTNSIIDTLPQHSYTIVSPTDELYPVIEYGRHEELLTFVQECEKESYIIPTEYVFMFVEKKPFRYHQAFWIQGPSWLALEKYRQNPRLDVLEISEEYAKRKVMKFSNLFWSYTQIESRVILESKAYEWCQRFQELYPYEMNIYYEDDDFVCYFFRQEPNAPYNLAIG